MKSKYRILKVGNTGHTLYIYSHQFLIQKNYKCWIFDWWHTLDWAFRLVTAKEELNRHIKYTSEKSKVSEIGDVVFEIEI